MRESLRVAALAVDLAEAALRALRRRSSERVAATEVDHEGPRAFIKKRAPRRTGR